MRLTIFLLAFSPLTWALILAVIFLLFGARQIPKFARALGESKRALKEVVSDKDRK